MCNGLRTPVRQLLVTLLLVGVTMAAWAAWLGWDQHRDLHPDGSTTGPYDAWQVIGLGLSVLVLVCWAASSGYAVAAAPATTAGLTVAASYDWSDDSSGLFAIGVGLVMIGSLIATSLLSLLVAALKQKPGVGRHRPAATAPGAASTFARSRTPASAGGVQPIRVWAPCRERPPRAGCEG